MICQPIDDEDAEEATEVSKYLSQLKIAQETLTHGKPVA